METENKDWKPEVGDVVWRFLRGDGMRLKAFRIKSFNRFADGDKYALLEMDDTQWPIQLDSIFPTPEAALTSIRVYDLEGKEVVIPRAIHFSGICSECGSSIALDAKQTNAMDKLVEAAYNMQLGDLPRVKQIPMRTIEEQNAMLSPDGKSYLIDKSEYFDWCLRNEDILCMFLDSKIRGGAAAGGKSDQREGGC